MTPSALPGIEEFTMNKPSFLTTLTLALICATASLHAQAQGGIPIPTVVTVETHDKNAAPPVVNREDVMVFEGHDRDTVTEWIPAQGDHAALELFILLDDGSAATLGNQLDDLRKFIVAQAPSTKVGIAYMQNGIAQIAQDLTSDHNQAAKALRLPLGNAGVSGSPYFAITDLAKRWPASTARHEAIVVTDGIDLYYGSNDLEDPYLNAAIEDAQRAGIIICGIYTPAAGHLGHSHWQTYWGQLYLAKLAEKTGGEAYDIGFNGSPVAFTPYLDDVAHRLQNQYLLTFQAKPAKKAEFKKIRITTELSKVDLVAPDAFYVPATR
jgi:hypothetical protein